MLLIFIHVLGVLLPAALPAPTVYDQRQSGNSNVKIDVKDVVLIAIADEFGDYDYSYDYSDLTIKPEVPSTPSKPVSVQSTTEQPTSPSTSDRVNATERPTSAATPVRVTPTQQPTTARVTESPVPQNASVVIDAGNSTLTFVPKPANETSEPERLTAVGAEQNYQIPVIVVHDVKENTKLLPVKIVEKSATGVRRTNATDEETHPRSCSPGFFLDSHNRCKRVRRPQREKPTSGPVPVVSV